MLYRALTPTIMAYRSALLALAGLILVTTACGGEGHEMGAMSPHATGSGGDHNAHVMAPSLGALTAESQGYRLSPAATTIPSGAAQRFSFQILTPAGVPLTRFAVDQTKRLHLYAIRRDLTDFQHVHPEMATDGTWSAPLNLSSPGPYRMVADFIALDDKSKPVPLALGVDFSVPGDYAATALPAPASRTTVYGYQVELNGSPMAGMEHKLTFTITQSGSGVTNLEPYLDAFGHLTAFRAGNLAYAHLHPAGPAAPGSKGGPNLAFSTNLPASGDYRFFLQFQVAGTVQTVAFTVPAS
jgi:hypothetical protein